MLAAIDKPGIGSILSIEKFESLCNWEEEVLEDIGDNSPQV